MNRFLRNLCTLLVMAALSPGAFAASAEKTPELDEVVVNGQQLDQVRKELVQLEDRFFQRYNELNTSKDFQIQCLQEERTGTRIGKRYCRGGYEEQAMTNEGQEAGRIRQYVQNELTKGNMSPNVPGSPPVPAYVAIEAKRPEFRKHMKEVVSQHPELIEMLQRHAALVERYDELRHKLFAPKP